MTDEEIIIITEVLNKAFCSRYKWDPVLKSFTDRKNTVWKTGSGKFMKKSGFSIDVHDITDIIEQNIESIPR
jgi:hypothetical protein